MSTKFTLGGNVQSGAQQQTAHEFQGKSGFQKASSGDEALAELGGFGIISASGNTVAGNANEFLEILKKVQDKTTNRSGALNTTLVKIESPLLIGSAVAVCYEHGDQLVYFTLIPEALSKTISNVFENGFNGKSIEIDIPTSFLWDQAMIDTTEEIIANILPSPHRTRIAKTKDDDDNYVGIKCAGNAIIHNEVDINVVEKVQVFYDAALVAISGVINLLNGNPTTASYQAPQGLTYKFFTNKGIGINSRFLITPAGDYLSRYFDPIVGDFNAIMTASSLDNTNKRNTVQSVHTVSKEQGITSIIGYFDVIRRQPNARVPLPNGLIPGYDLVTVITQLTAQGLPGVRMIDSLISQLLGLTLVIPLIDSTYKRWTAVFEPFAGEKNVKTSLGVIGLEYNNNPQGQFQPKELKVTNVANYNQLDDALTPYQIASNYFYEGGLVALDVTHGSPVAWVQEIITNARPGTNYEKMVLAELDAFTEGLFSQLWLPLNESIIADEPAQIHSGYYSTQSGLADIRKVDYLSILQECLGDQSIMDPFSRGFMPGSRGYEAMDIKRKSLKQAAPTAVIKGITVRNFINPIFIVTIERALKQLDVSINIEGLQDINNQSDTRGSYNTAYLKPIHSSGAYSTRNVVGAQQQGNVNRFTSRNSINNRF